MIVCCYKCEKRYPGCHSKCKDYINEKKQNTRNESVMLGRIATKDYFIDKQRRLRKK